MSDLPLVSIIVLNYNGERWMDRCLQSLREQTIFDQLEIIVADNDSTDGSMDLADKIMEGWVNGRAVRFGENLGYCEGNNRGAALATGRFLFFLNYDAWLEPDCMEVMMRTIDEHGAHAATPIMLNYDDDSLQSAGGAGFDAFGLFSLGKARPVACEIFVVGGCSYLIRSDVFVALGTFDRVLFMYADEYDLSWRLWLAGYKALLVPDARMHHRGAASENPAGGEKMMELRTSHTKRFYTNRNVLMLLLKNCQHVLLLLVPMQLLFLAAEATASLVIVRQWSFVRRAYFDAIVACWGLRDHIRAERRRIGRLRKRSDWWMMRFFRLRPNRWEDLKLIRKHGLPKVNKR